LLNRLNLNWKLEWSDERSAFLASYLNSIPFTPNAEELDTMSKYVLWGKNRQTGLNGRQEGLELETRSGTWDSHEVESLEALLDSPTFNENSILSADMAPPRLNKEVFSRNLARKNAPPLILSALEEIWRQIDELELITSLYDLHHNKRTTPIRQKLLDRFDSAQINSIDEASTHLSIYAYLQKRHQLVDLRRQQYTLKDSYAPTLIFQLEPALSKPDTPTFGNEIEVRPFGIDNGTLLDRKIFNQERFPRPDDFTEEDLKQITKQIWKRTSSLTSAPAASTSAQTSSSASSSASSSTSSSFLSSPYFDFTDPKHLYALYSNFSELDDLASNLTSSLSETSTIREFLRAASTYRKLAHLDPIHEDILTLKIAKKSNNQIADLINAKYSKSYKPNYISTLYCQKCLEGIAQAARDHFEVMENIMFEENFKKCKDCGEVLLLSEKNFVRRHRANDGFSPRCKRCEKLARERKKLSKSQSANSSKPN